MNRILHIKIYKELLIIIKIKKMKFLFLMKF